MPAWGDYDRRLFALHRAKLESIVARRVRDRDAAADIVQDVFFHVVEAAPTGLDEGDAGVIYAAT